MNRRWRLWLRHAPLGALVLACGSRSQLLGGEAPEARNDGGVATSGGAAGGVSAGGVNVAGKSASGGASQGGKPQTEGGQPGEAGQVALLGGAGGAAGAGPDDNAGAAGAPAPSVPDVLWGKRFGDYEALQRAYGIAVEPNGDFNLTGTMFGEVDFGTGVLSSLVDHGAFVAQFDADGAARWSHVYGGPSAQDGLGIAVADDGTLSVAGRFAGSIDFGGGALKSQGLLDAFLASFDHDGHYRFAKGFGDVADQSFASVAVTSTGRAVVAGYFLSDVDVGGGTRASAGSIDALIAMFDKQGAYQWDQPAGDALVQRARGVARSAWDDSLFVVGELQGSLKLGACSSLISQGGNDAWLGWFDSSGNCLHGVRFGDEANQDAFAVATSKGANNLIAVAGHFSGVIDLGGKIKAADADDAFVALFQADNSTGGLFSAWVRRISGRGRQIAHAVAFDSADNLVVVGDSEGDDRDVGLVTSGDRDAFAVKYDVSGNVVWAKSFGSAGEQIAYAVGTDGLNNVYVAGSFEGDLPLSTGTLQSAGSDDIFVVKLAP